MLQRALDLLPKKSRNVVLTVGSMGALLAGRKVVALSMLGKGIVGLEEGWREAHPDFDGDLQERLDEAIVFYDDTHQDSMNRKLHMVGIPMILGGTAGLLMFKPLRPLWFTSASLFTTGWLLNLVGHGLFEKNAPAFADDPVAFVAGPVWDLKYKGRPPQVKNRKRRAKGDDEGMVIDVTPEPSAA